MKTLLRIQHTRRPVLVLVPGTRLPWPDCSVLQLDERSPQAINTTISSTLARFNPTIASSSNCITAATNTNTNLIASPKSSSSSTVSSPRSPRFAQRNPVTGNGVEDYADKPRKPSSRRGENGNPVTGEGYKSGGAAEINTTVPSLNGAGHVINKNRIPPGGFSSGLW
ncbi:AAEL014490-PA [Aedes aegypti]|uniref:AAEL014490-PA n=1 Tax=Aedes aegypti TaxID=7159 RepID=Q16G84_AEDAE|nr:AAEL014490-PA [Aedes aegypti]